MTRHPDSEAFLREVAGLGLPPSAGAAVSQIRERYRTLCRHFAGDPPSVAEVQELALPCPARVYAPAPDAPILVWFHGGRMITGDLETHDPLCRWLASLSGWRVLAVDYRLAPEHPYPAAVQDATAAVNWARSQAARVAIGGDSAGAWLALAAGKADALVLAYPMVDAACVSHSHLEFRNGPGTSSEDIRFGYRLWLGGRFAAPPLPDPCPPAYVLISELDPLRDEGRALAARLGAKESVFEGHIHGFLTYPARFGEARRAYDDIAQFLATLS
jgi:acetyl esterase